MTLVSDHGKFVFVHVPKTGGTSVKSALSPYESTDAWLARSPERRHLRARDLMEVGAGYYRFSVVRNPYAQLVSFWSYKLENPFHPDYAEIAGHGTFDRWVRAHAAHPWALQSNFTHDSSGTQLIDDYFHTERLQQDWPRLLTNCGLADVPLDRMNRSDHRPVADYYDDRLAAFVADRWAADFERFGYPAEIETPMPAPSPSTRCRRG